MDETERQFLQAQAARDQAWDEVLSVLPVIERINAQAWEAAAHGPLDAAGELTLILTSFVLMEVCQRQILRLMEAYRAGR